MKQTKIIFLFLILIFPVLIYLFLQGFGKNQFAIPIYYESGIISSLGGCQLEKDGNPYQLNKKELTQLFDKSVALNNITVYEVGNSDNDQLRNNLYTFLEKYKNHRNVKLVSVKTLDDTIFSPSKYEAWQRYNLSDSNLMRLGRCILQLDVNTQLKADSGLVLVDQKQQIRGYYDPMILKEIDRLNTELHILLSE